MADLKNLYGLLREEITLDDEARDAIIRIITGAINGEKPSESDLKKASVLNSRPRSPAKSKRSSSDAESDKEDPIAQVKATAQASARAKAKQASAEKPKKGAEPVKKASPAAKRQPDPSIELDDDDLEDITPLDDPWFSDEPKTKRASSPPPIPKAALKKASRPLAPNLPAPKPASVKLGKGKPGKPRGVDWAKDQALPGEFPDLPAPKPANAKVSSDDDGDDDYKPPYGFIGTGWSSWDDVPSWMKDTGHMPKSGGGSQRVPRTPKPVPPSVGDDDSEAPYTGPDPVGRQWLDKDFKKKRPSLLQRMFGRK